jgi:hypothetical protein
MKIKKVGEDHELINRLLILVLLPETKIRLLHGQTANNRRLPLSETIPNIWLLPGLPYSHFLLPLNFKYEGKKST